MTRATQPNAGPAKQGQLEPVTYRLPAYWASYLINGDASGLLVVEQRDADEFLRKFNLPSACSCEPAGFCGTNDAGTLAGDCEDYTFLIAKGRALK